MTPMIAMDGKSKRLKIGHNELAHIKGSTTQFKEEDGGKRYWPQMFADMARVAHLLVVECLQIGKHQCVWNFSQVQNKTGYTYAIHS